MDYEKNEIITNDFYIKEIIEKKKYLELILKNEDEEEVSAILRDNIDLFIRVYKKGDHIICKAKVRKKKEKIYLEIGYIKKYDLKIEDTTKNRINSEDYVNRFFQLIDSIKDTDYRELLDGFFGNEKTKELFFESPAAKNNHHNYEFGLLQHSVEVAEVAIFIGEYFGDVNLDLLITGCLLHDIGKVKSYEFEKNTIKKTDWEYLLGHLSISTIFVSKVISSNFPANKAMMLYHLILSHHGRLAYGSPIEYKMKEAKILNVADGLSVTMNRLNSFNYINHWSKFDDLTKRIWYKG